MAPSWECYLDIRYAHYITYVEENSHKQPRYKPGWLFLHDSVCIDNTKSSCDFWKSSGTAEGSLYHVHESRSHVDSLVAAAPAHVTTFSICMPHYFSHVRWDGKKIFTYVFKHLSYVHDTNWTFWSWFTNFDSVMIL